MRITVRTAASIGALVTSACASAPPEATTRAPTPTPLATVAPVASSTTVVDAAPPVKTDFHLVARTPATQPLRFVTFDDAAFVWSYPIFAKLEGERLVRDDKWATGRFDDVLFDGFSFSVGALGAGTAHVAWIATDGRVGWSELSRWNGARWDQAGRLSRTWGFVAVAPWSNGRVLGLAHRGLAFDAAPSLELRLVGAGAGPLPKLPTTLGECRDEKGGAMTVEGFHATRSGHVFIAARACDRDEHFAIWYAPGAPTPTVVDLGQNPPGKPLDDCFDDDATRFVGTRGDDVMLATASRCEPGLLARFDGTTFKVIEYPGTRLGRLTRTPNGALYVVDGTTLRRRAPDGTWSEPRLPADAAPIRDLFARGDDDVWITAGASLYHGQPPSGPVQELAWPEAGKQIAPPTVRQPRAARPGCESLFVLLFSFSKVTPDDYDFPLTRKALQGRTDFAGARFVVTKDGGQKFFGAFVPTFELGKKMVELVTKRVSSSSPQLLCAKPDVVREVAIDLKTGELRK